MQNGSHKESMAPGLEDLLNDYRLSRLFLDGDQDCALQLWILQIKSEHSIENRIVYGRLVPYRFSNNQWYASDKNNFDTFGQAQAQVIQLKLYLKSSLCKEVLTQLTAGRTISEISEELNLGLCESLKARLGATALTADKLVYRPVAYLLNRDAPHNVQSLSSPHGEAGAFSASITQTDKEALFRLGGDYDVSLAALAVKRLNTDTGLDFGNTDIVRFGDIELLVFPTLDDFEGRLLHVNRRDNQNELVIQFNPTQIPYFQSFQFRLSILNDGQVVYSSIATPKCGEQCMFEYVFELNDQLVARIDSAELEIFGFSDENSCEGTLCCRWSVRYIREINIEGGVANQTATPVKFDWLEETTRSSDSGRVNAALKINRDNPAFNSRIGGRDADPWVQPNRDLVSLFERIHPPKSEGQFFQRWGPSNGEGRIQFVEWFKALLAKYEQHQLIIFDPYFDTAGLGLLLICAASKADYIVFTSLPKPSKENEGAEGAYVNTNSERLKNLEASCEDNRRLLKHIKLRIYGLKEGRLHDRYILIMGADGLPVAGFNLSNSFQKAAENYPLLVTPIPADVLLKVEKYKSDLVREEAAALEGGETKNASMQLLFDSTKSSPTSRPCEPLHFLDKAQAGDVLSIWANEPSLQDLSGDPLKTRMTALGLLKHDSLELPEASPSLGNCLNQLSRDFERFVATWEIIGDVLARTHIEEYQVSEILSKHGLLEFMARFLEKSFNREHIETDKELAVIDPRLFRESIENLLHSSYHPDNLCHPIKYADLTWSEYFAIKVLWLSDPDSLLTIAETQIADLEVEPESQDAIRLALLSQIVSDIAHSLHFDISEKQRDRLIRSGNGLLQWIGLNTIKMQLEETGGLSAVLELLETFTYVEKVRALGWMVNHTAKDPENAENYKGLVKALHEALPATIPADELRRLVDSLRGHMLGLSWSEPWLFQDVVFPLLRNERINVDDACAIWIEELAFELKAQPLLFDRSREGQVTNIAAFLFASSSFQRKQASLESISSILNKQKRIIQQPLASTSDWTRWDSALVISMWILAFTRWGQYYLHEQGISDEGLDGLSRSARDLAMVRPMDEWRSLGASQPNELVAFLEQVEELLASSDE